MDRIVNEICYFGAAIGGLLGAAQMLSRREKWRSLALVFISVVLFMDALTWHDVHDTLARDAHVCELSTKIEKGFDANPLEVAIAMSKEPELPWFMHAIDIACVSIAIAMVGVAHNLHMTRKGSFTIFLLAVVGYCGLVVAYWWLLGTGGHAVHDLASATKETLAQRVDTTAQTVFRCYGSFAALAMAALFVFCILKKKAASYTILRTMFGTSMGEELRWAIACVAAFVAASLYTWLGPQFQGPDRMWAVCVQITFVAMIGAVRFI